MNDKVSTEHNKKIERKSISTSSSTTIKEKSRLYGII